MMGLPLRNPNSFSLNSGASPPGGSSDLGSTSEPSCYGISSRPLRIKQQPRRPHRDSIHRPNTDSRHSSVDPRNKSSRHNHLRKAHHLRAARLRHRYPCAADADEACELARSSARLAGEQSQCHQDYGNSGADWRRPYNTSRSRSASLSPRRRPPSLERQDAFRDKKTVKRRQLSSSCSWNPHMDLDREEEDAGYLVRMERDEEEGARYLAEMERREEEEVAELYRIGLLYDDEYERGEGFSLGAIFREQPLYSVRERPARRGRQDGKDGFISLSLDLAFSAFGEDDALAAWLVSGCDYGSGPMDGVHPAGFPPRDAQDDTQLTVIYELADDAVSAVSAYDILDSVSVSEMSYFQPDENDDDDLAWRMRDGCNEEEDAPAAAAAGDGVVQAVAVEDDLDPWVVLGHDGS